MEESKREGGSAGLWVHKSDLETVLRKKVAFTKLNGAPDTVSHALCSAPPAGSSEHWTSRLCKHTSSHPLLSERSHASKRLIVISYE